MNWEKAYQMIISNIKKDLEINTKNSTFRVILETPPYKCVGYNSEGFKVKIGDNKNSWIEIPISMLKGLYENAIENRNTYNNSVFIKLYEKQQIAHPCHVHVVGQLFVNAKLAIENGSRDYKLI